MKDTWYTVNCQFRKPMSPECSIPWYFLQSWYWRLYPLSSKTSCPSQLKSLHVLCVDNDFFRGGFIGTLLAVWKHWLKIWSRTHIARLLGVVYWKKGRVWSVSWISLPNPLKNEIPFAHCIHHYIANRCFLHATCGLSECVALHLLNILL